MICFPSTSAFILDTLGIYYLKRTLQKSIAFVIRNVF